MRKCYLDSEVNELKDKVFDLTKELRLTIHLLEKYLEIELQEKVYVKNKKIYDK